MGFGVRTFGVGLQVEKRSIWVTFEWVGDEMSGVFESRFLAFLQSVFPKIISRSVDIPECVSLREPQYSFAIEN